MALPFILAATGANAADSAPRGLEQMPKEHTVISQEIIEGGKLDLSSGKRIKDGTQRLSITSGPAELKDVPDAAKMQHIGSLLQFKKTGQTRMPAPIEIFNKAFPDTHPCHQIQIAPVDPKLVKDGQDFFAKHGDAGVKELKKSIDMGAYVSANTYGLAPIEKNDPKACPLVAAP